MAAATISLCGSRCLGPNLWPEPLFASQAAAAVPLYARPSSSRRRLVLVAATEGKKADEKVPSWARPGSDEAPPWARGEAAQGADGAVQIGSIFEYTNGRAVFGVVGTDSPFYAPILGFFAVTGIPTSGYLWYKAVQTANKDAEEQDRRDGFL